MKFSKEFLIDEAEETELLTEVVDSRRWVDVYRMVFEHDGKLYETFYERGKTENQWVDMYEDQPDEIECNEVFKKEKLVVIYE